MSQVNAAVGSIPDELRAALEAGLIGSILNEVDVDVVNELQRIAVEDSRLGIPLLMGRDVIHGFKTVLPIPLGQAATWNPELVQNGARIAALEAASTGVNWTFAPMIDISRDPRWGRIAESFGEDPYLTSVLGAAMIKGFQGDGFSEPGNIAACAKHFAGYGASESGRDYNTTNIPENELRNVYLRPFKAAVDAGVATLMTSFSDLNGVPASGNRFLLKQVLRDEWRFDGFVVSDWASIQQLVVHGFAANDLEAAFEAASARSEHGYGRLNLCQSPSRIARRRPHQHGAARYHGFGYSSRQIPAGPVREFVHGTVRFPCPRQRRPPGDRKASSRSKVLCCWKTGTGHCRWQKTSSESWQ